MAPVAYAKPSNSTSDNTNAFDQIAGNSDPNSERSSVYAFPPSWLKNSGNNTPAKLTTLRSPHSSGKWIAFVLSMLHANDANFRLSVLEGSAFVKTTDNRQDNTEYRGKPILFDLTVAR